MLARELRKKYIDFFHSKGHAVIKSAPLIPDNDPTVLFTTAGMHPLVPYLLGGNIRREPVLPTCRNVSVPGILMK